ncbi:LytR/AlgR family response regulator transcription factor [Sinomicrobium soli]|uniref:LytR/AlgR family response regulator transcription factor n=1 Tax=Sinomicrobium sp. N-1-3-6 TaxID=2219864 RepID=UPI000DCCD604|nr:LytTR family DNA-binding domain-containing protein [Sinomicrobium sp. N-1-3-6]RAV27464.1 DNA-binding response regulator [Sinomicrobium sp. N-1-3-6]
MIKTVIIEDEPAIRKEIEWLLGKQPDLELVGTAGSVLQGVSVIRDKKPNLLLMDIQLTDGTAFDLLKRIGDTGLQVIFITAYNDHAIKAIKFGALDYLLKPLDENELQSALDRVYAGFRKPVAGVEVRQQLQVAEEQMYRKPEETAPVASLEDQIVLHTMEYLQLLQIKDIVYCKSEGSYTTFVLHDKREIMVSRPLKYYDDLLPEKWFIRPHQSYLLNLLFVDRYVKAGYIYLKDHSQIPVSVRKKDYVLQRLTQQRTL